MIKEQVTIPILSIMKENEKTFHYVDSFESQYIVPMPQYDIISIGSLFLTSGPSCTNGLMAIRNKIVGIFRLKTTIPINNDDFIFEVGKQLDKYSKTLITRNIELLLDYCQRFYDRQFITREQLNLGALEKFENQLNTYFKSDKPQLEGLPSVAYFADQLNLSANYFGDMVKKETGKSAQEYIHLKIMTIAKERILDETKSVSEIAYELGFKYPQHFTQMFKKSVGMSPSEFRGLN